MSALQEIAIDLEAERASKNSTLGRYPTNEGASGVFTWLSRLPIGKKIIVFFSGNLLVALAAAGVILWGLYEIYNRSNAINEAREQLLIAQQIVADLDTAALETQIFQSTGNEAHRLAANDKLNSADEGLEALRNAPNGMNPGLQGQFANIEAGAQSLKGGLDPAGGISSGEAVTLREASTTTRSAAQAIADAFAVRVEKLSDSISSLIWFLLTVWGSLVAALCLTALYTQYYFHRHVGGAISDLSDQMTRLAAGEKMSDLKASERGDEIGEMSRAMMVFHRAGVRLERLSRERSQKAKAELEEQTRLQVQQEEARLEREQTLLNIASQFERTVGDVVGSVASASSQLQTTATAMAASAEQAATRTSDVATSMVEANSGATAAAAASDEFAMSIGEISRQAASSAELARKATMSATEADATISELSDSAEQVGHIVELIQTIAQRTNLLALNASIEAARGGEAGRGFAVVASEVKELAMQTSRATEQVAEQIRTMQDTTGASVKALRSIANEVAQLETTAVSIASAVDQQSVAGQDLARSIDLAARGTERVSGHIKEVHELSVSTGSAASQVLSSATALEQQASTLRKQVDDFLAKVRAG